MAQQQLAHGEVEWFFPALDDGTPSAPLPHALCVPDLILTVSHPAQLQTQQDAHKPLSRRHSSFLSSLESFLASEVVARPPRVVTSQDYVPELPELSPASDAPEDAFGFQDEPSAPRGSSKAKSGKLFECARCPKTYATAEGLRLHTRSKHDNDRSSVCKQCGKSFIRNSDLRLHVLRMHETSRPHACEHCPKTFACKSEMRRHQLTHARRITPEQFL